MGEENKQHKHTVIYNHAKISFVLYCSYSALDPVQQIPCKKPSQYKVYTGENRASNEIFFFFLTQTQQSFRNNLKGGEQSVKLLSRKQKWVKWHKVGTILVANLMSMVRSVENKPRFLFNSI